MLKQIILPVYLRYILYRRYGTSNIISIYMTALYTLLWLCLKLESKQWQYIRLHFNRLYPQISLTGPHPGDPIRVALQSLGLLIFKPKSEELKFHQKLKLFGSKLLVNYRNKLSSLLKNTKKYRIRYLNIKKSSNLEKLLIVILTGLSFFLILASITSYFEPLQQFIFLITMWFIGASVIQIHGRITTIILVILSIIASSRYIWWRYSNTLIWLNVQSEIFGTLLIIAETYIFIILLLSYMQSIWPLNRNPTPLPKNKSQWPIIDVFITTYNEELDIIKLGATAALGLDWPKKKLNIYILDDGNRLSVKNYAREIGVNYISRTNNKHAKAGNINNALKQTSGEFITMFDCDFIATRPFLQLTIGWFLQDKNLALLQTPHHFFSKDPFEQNLNIPENIPSENQLFYGVVQDGSDLWNATFFCGSCGIFRRTSLEEIGGLATESVTEDAMTSLRLQREGFNSAYIRIPMAAGLATESISRHLKQRMRWARGMAQILRIDNPLLGKGLSLMQRLCYFNSMLYFLSGIPRLIFYISPLTYIFFGAYIFYAPVLMVILYALPHLIHAVMANSRIQGKYRHFLWNEIYETVMSWYIALPTTLALINPKIGKFNVTSKGGINIQQHTDWKNAKPYVILALLNILGLIIAILSLLFGPDSERSTTCIVSIWIIYNLIIMGGVLGVYVESKQIRRSPRVKFTIPALLKNSDGYLFSCNLINYSANGVRINLDNEFIINRNEEVKVIIKNNNEEFSFSGKVTNVHGKSIGILLDNMALEEYINYIQATFARADTWAIWQTQFTIEHPVNSMKEILNLSFKGYASIIQFTPFILRLIISSIYGFTRWLLSYFPKRISL